MTNIINEKPNDDGELKLKNDDVRVGYKRTLSDAAIKLFDEEISPKNNISVLTVGTFLEMYGRGQSYPCKVNEHYIYVGQRLKKACGIEVKLEEPDDESKIISNINVEEAKSNRDKIQPIVNKIKNQPHEVTREEFIEYLKYQEQASGSPIDHRVNPWTTVREDLSYMFEAQKNNH